MPQWSQWTPRTTKSETAASPAMVIPHVVQGETIQAHDDSRPRFIQRLASESCHPTIAAKPTILNRYNFLTGCFAEGWTEFIARFTSGVVWHVPGSRVSDRGINRPPQKAEKKKSRIQRFCLWVGNGFSRTPLRCSRYRFATRESNDAS